MERKSVIGWVEFTAPSAWYQPYDIVDGTEICDWLGRVYRPVSMVPTIWDANVGDMGWTWDGLTGCLWLLFLWSPRQKVTHDKKLRHSRCHFKIRNLQIHRFQFTKFTKMCEFHVVAPSCQKPFQNHCTVVYRHEPRWKPSTSFIIANSRQWLRWALTATWETRV